MAAEATGALSIPGLPAEAAGTPIPLNGLAVLVPTAVRRCSAYRADGQPCGATPLREAPFCFVHDPGSVELAIEARHLGGVRRRREKTVKRVYDVTNLATVEGMRRYLEVAVSELLALDNSVPRNRALIAAVHEGVYLHEHGELAAEVRAQGAEIERMAAEAAADKDHPA